MVHVQRTVTISAQINEANDYQLLTNFPVWLMIISTVSWYTTRHSSDVFKFKGSNLLCVWISFASQSIFCGSEAGAPRSKQSIMRISIQILSNDYTHSLRNLCNITLN